MAGTEDITPKHTFLVLHDYGMGGLWWWVRARSTREVRETFARVEVITDPETLARFKDEDLEEVDIDSSRMPPGLDDLYAERAAQRGRAGFGVLVDRDIVHLSLRGENEDGAPVDQLVEVDPDGRRFRQVEVAEDGTAVRSSPDDWLFNPPVVDLFDPALADREISRGDFEAQWARARQEDSGL
ncbi:hypothetical protein OHU11_16905 [Streptomyces sp. NBC_00257]|uniref:hypothetical protein n=1 Tax=unclassified Streptomyces TaxID=2593676 RepID=UPI0022556756|nr:MULTISPECIES: hypothetical protein [unclassified Streptomyces]WTB56455.1 hypothetical protein OG832_26510 [Streptomyces sp. NBC_00826]WTH90662.1 hypothetical protein OIC43_17185 [Streptomyces sp. NBC_00825]WTH99388.1 hypothetical protein OHA23_17170 [Streptomyces sp. NBC_00822]MCX4864822.1 hypothetical protein [Streptomyces sp. NBC_00906]MCX4896060.1 hypothetical protein [Streptomyces sp. NBC_00892]